MNSRLWAVWELIITCGVTMTSSSVLLWPSILIILFLLPFVDLCWLKCCSPVNSWRQICLPSPACQQLSSILQGKWVYCCPHHSAVSAISTASSYHSAVSAISTASSDPFQNWEKMVSPTNQVIKVNCSSPLLVRTKQGSQILSCQEAIQMIYRMLFVLNGCGFVPEIGQQPFSLCLHDPYTARYCHTLVKTNSLHILVLYCNFWKTCIYS